MTWRWKKNREGGQLHAAQAEKAPPCTRVRGRCRGSNLCAFGRHCRSTVYQGTGRRKNRFFTDAKSQAQVQNVLDAPRGEYGGQQTDTEGHNTEIGQTQTLDGVNYTLDTVSMDAATLDCFFTVSGENVMSKFLDADSIYPEWEQLSSNTPWMAAQINGGEEIYTMQSDFYRQGDDTFRLWLHYQLPEEPQGDTVMLRLLDSHAAAGEPGLSYTMELNGEQVRAGARRVAPTVLDFGITDALLGDNPITLDSLCFGTGSGSLAVHSEADEKFAETHPFGVVSEDEEKKLRGEDADNPVIFNGGMILTDDTGRELLPSSPDGVSGGAVAYTVPAENAQSITFTPVYHSGVYEYEERTVTVDEMQQGVKIATSDAGGYTLQNFAVQGRALTWQMVPYGYAQSCELTPQDEEYIDTNTNSYAMRSSTVDPTTGIISCRIDYYTADPAQVAKNQRVPVCVQRRIPCGRKPCCHAAVAIKKVALDKPVGSVVQ